MGTIRSPFEWKKVSESSGQKSREPTSGHILARNVIWNLFGQAAPLLVALVSIPKLIEGLGADRFGILTLAWMIIGYFSLFDFGLGRALTKLVAEKISVNATNEIPSLAWTGLSLMLVLGLVGTLILICLAPWFAHSALKIPQAIQEETRNSFYLLAMSIPIVVVTTGLRGLLEAAQRFGIVNLIRIPMGIFTFVGPLLVLPFSHSLVPITLVLVAMRVFALAAHLLMCLKTVPHLRSEFKVRRDLAWPMLSLGGWMTVTNTIGPLMVYLDRFLIGAFISMAAVAYYVTPYEIVTKLWLIPGALVGVLFPAFAETLMHDQDRAAKLYWRGVKYIFLSVFPLVLVTTTFAYEGLNLWISAEFATKGFRVLQWLAVGVLINSLAFVPFSLIQSAGRPDITAKLHLVELPVYLLLLWVLLQVYSIEGVAIAWTLRVAIDAIGLFYVAQKIVPSASAKIPQSAAVTPLAALFALLIASQLTEVIVKVAFVVCVLIVSILVTWRYILANEERAALRSKLM